MTDPTDFTALRKGLLEFLILAVASSGKVYSGDLLERLEDTDFATREGTLYPLLNKMRREDLLDYEWQESESGPPRKYYHLTTAGQTRLGDFHKYWMSTTDLITDLSRRPWKK